MLNWKVKENIFTALIAVPVLLYIAYSEWQDRRWVRNQERKKNG